MREPARGVKVCSSKMTFWTKMEAMSPRSRALKGAEVLVRKPRINSIPSHLQISVSNQLRPTLSRSELRTLVPSLSRA
jgi:hypothetical protein